MKPPKKPMKKAAPAKAPAKKPPMPMEDAMPFKKGGMVKKGKGC